MTTLKDFAMNIITLGAHGRVQMAARNYDNRVEELQDLHKLHEDRKKEVNKLLLKVIEIKRIAIVETQKVKEITDLLNAKQREEIEQNLGSKDYTFSQIEGRLSAGEMALNVSKDNASDPGSAFGTWALAGSSDGVSTRTILGSSSTNATLAWLGGGSVAVGGALGGALFLGGLIAIPSLAINGLLQHFSVNNEIDTINDRESEIVKAIEDIKKNLVAFDAIEKRSIGLIESLVKAIEDFQLIYNDVNKSTHPFGSTSRNFKSLKKFFTGRYFGKKDLDQIKVLVKYTGAVLGIVDSKIVGT